MKHTILTILTLSLATSALSQSLTQAERDSLMDVAYQRRAVGAYTQALDIYGHLGGNRARLERAETYLELGIEQTDSRPLSPAEMGYGTYGKAHNFTELALQEAKIMQKDATFPYQDEARLIEGRARNAQGFTTKAKRIYKKLAEKGNAEAMFYLSKQLYAEGHLQEAEYYAQKAIIKDPLLTPAHRLLSTIELSMGHRYQALLPIYRYLLTASDAGREESITQLRSLWRNEPWQFQLLGKRTDEEPYSEKMEKKIDEICAQFGDQPTEATAIIEQISQKTDSLLAHMRDTGEENLDFWQIAYADFLIEVHARGYVRALTYFIFDPVYNTQVLAWLADNTAYFNEFRMWMEGALAKE